MCVWGLLVPSFKTAITITVENQIEGDQVMIHWRAHGTHRGTFMDILATGKIGEVSGVSIYRFANKRIREVWTVWDGRSLGNSSHARNRTQTHHGGVRLCR